MERKTLRAVRTIRSSLARNGFQGGWIEAVHRVGGTLSIQIRDRQERGHRFCFEGVVAASGLDGGGFVHGAYVAPDHEAGNVAADPPSSRVPFRFSLIGEDALIEVAARTLRIDEPERPMPRFGALRNAV